MELIDAGIKLPLRVLQFTFSPTVKESEVLREVKNDCSKAEILSSNNRIVFLDTETNSRDPETGRVLEIGCVEYIDGRPTGNNFHQYFACPDHIEPGAEKVHGLSREFLAQYPIWDKKIAGELINFLDGADVVIYNAPFDLNFINTEFKRIFKDIFPWHGRVIDPLLYTRKLWPREGNKLSEVADRLGIELTDIKLHSATDDAALLGLVYFKLIQHK